MVSLPPSNQDDFRLFGPLETQIIEILWANADQWMTVQQISQAMVPAGHYKTVQTVMNRLVTKEILQCRHHQRAYEYTTKESRDRYITQYTRQLLDKLVRTYGDIAIAQFVEAVQEVRPDQLALLEKLMATEITDEDDHS